MIQMKATGQDFLVVLSILLYKAVLIFESVDEILWCDHSNESYWAVLPVLLFVLLYKVALTFEYVDEIQCVTIQKRAFIEVCSC